ncbi:MAG: YlbF family regulator [Clostridia bacterium]|nr:YlbF family regulator [Clostridia bacterium]MBQ6859219.1 YlbF family regulator [Clostridia bacterium]MBQ7052813.1 YlbF family regulator [Clostridia bacterium]
MSKVTECARALGEAIVESEEYKNMQVTEAAAMSNPEVAAAMSRFLELKEALGNAMCQPDTDADLISRYGKEMDEVQQTLNAMPIVEDMTRSRQQFSELMNQVNRVLEYIITGELQQGGGCSGNCSGCSGCH